MLTDSHCHLQRLPLSSKSDLKMVLHDAREHDVSRILCVGVSLEETETMLNIAKQYPDIYCAVGTHPSEVVVHEPSVEDIVSHAQDPLVVAIGETGLDYHYEDVNIALQRERFVKHIHAARQAEKSLIIHLREASKDMLEILEAEKAYELGGVMHCYTDTWEVAQQLLDWGFYIGISGIVTFNKAENVRVVARQMPLDRLLIETDAPYLAPVPKRGKPNEPAFLQYTAKYLAQLRGISYEDLAQRTTENFNRLFFGNCSVLNNCIF